MDLVGKEPHWTDREAVLVAVECTVELDAVLQHDDVVAVRLVHELLVAHTFDGSGVVRRGRRARPDGAASGPAPSPAGPHKIPLPIAPRDLHMVVWTTRAEYCPF